MAGDRDLAAVHWPSYLERVPADMDELVSEWIAYISLTAATPPAHGTPPAPGFWAWEAADHLADDYPGEALAFILAVLRQPVSQIVRANLAAGPLEDLLVRRGPEAIGQVEQLARDEPAFRDALLGVWQNRTAADIWRRVRIARGDLDVR